MANCISDKLNQIMQFNEAEYNDYSYQDYGFNKRPEELGRRKQEKKQIDEFFQERQISEMAERQKLLERRFERQLSEKSITTPSSSDLIIEKLAVKFCFFSDKILNIQNRIATESIELKTEINVNKLLSIVFSIIKKEAEQMGVSKKEVSDAITNMLRESNEIEINDIFIKHFLGSTAVNIYTTNPEIIKDIKAHTKDGGFDYAKAIKEFQELIRKDAEIRGG